MVAGIMTSHHQARPNQTSHGASHLAGREFASLQHVLVSGPRPRLGDEAVQHRDGVLGKVKLSSCLAQLPNEGKKEMTRIGIVRDKQPTHSVATVLDRRRARKSCVFIYFGAWQQAGAGSAAREVGGPTSGPYPQEAGRNGRAAPMALMHESEVSGPV